MSEAQLRPASKPGIKLDVRDDDMIVTLPGTSYTVTYYRPANSRSFSPKICQWKMIGARRCPTSWLVLDLANEKARNLAGSLDRGAENRMQGVHGSMLASRQRGLWGAAMTPHAGPKPAQPGHILA